MSKSTTPTKCPACKNPLTKAKSEKLLKYGIKIKQCPGCGYAYDDPDVTELAICGITPNDRKVVRNPLAKLIFFGIGIVCIALLILSCMYSDRIYYILVFGSFLVFTTIYDTIKDIFTYKKRQSLLDEEYRRSVQRMSTPAYQQLYEKYTNGLPLNDYSHMHKDIMQ